VRAPACIACVSIRQHTSAYAGEQCVRAPAYTACVSICQYTSAYVSMRQGTSAYVRIRGIRQHTSAYVSIRQHTWRHARTSSGGPAQATRRSSCVSICTFVPVGICTTSARVRGAVAASVFVLLYQLVFVLLYQRARGAKRSSCASICTFVLLYQSSKSTEGTPQ
jgi:hypothetical protein